MAEKNPQRIHRLFSETEQLARMGHYEWDETNGSCSYCSEGLARILGTTVDDYLQRMNSQGVDALQADLQFVHTDDRAAYLAAVEEGRRNRTGFKIEYRLITLGGDCIEVREVVEAGLDVDGEMIRFFGFVQDISESRQLERDLRRAHDELEYRVSERTAALQESEARYREIVEESPIGLWEEDWSQIKRIIDKLVLDGVTDLATYFDANPGHLEELLLAAESNSAVSQYVYELYELSDHQDFAKWREQEGVAAEELVRFRETLIKVYEQQWTDYFEEAYLLENGKARYLSVRTVMPERHRHDWSRMIYTITDITELKNSGDRLSQATRLAGVGYYVWDAIEDRCLYCSEQHARMHGLSSEEYILRASRLGETFCLTHPEDRQSLATAMQHLRNGNPITVEYRTLMPDGSSRHVREIAEPIFDDEKRVIREIGSSQDITEQKLIETRLRESQKLEAVGRLTSGVAHDFNNLLAVIMGNTDLLLEEGGGDHSMLESILHAAERGATLTRQLLAFSMEQTLLPAAISLNAVVENMLQMLARTLGKTIQIDTSLDLNLRHAFADRHQLENAILNLAINARDAMPKGGKLLIETARTTLDDASSGTEAFITPGDYATLVITDDGHGMTEEVLERAFEPFFTTKDVSKGSGLGLAMVFGFAKQSGGYAEILSEPNSGTSVRLHLPNATD